MADTEVREERKVVTILFADVIGSTALGEQLDPERLRALLGVFFKAMASIIESWGGTVEKYIGDAIMAVFGVPIVHEDDAERALRAAIEMRERLVELNADFERQHKVTLKVRVGVNTGEVVTLVGPTPEHGFVTGDAVNTAQRLEAAAEPGEILAGERTYAVAQRAFRFMEPRALDLKGKSGAVSAYGLIEALAEASPRGVRGLSSPMIGRDREHVTLTGLLDETIEGGRPRLVVIYGSAGIGKSRLTAEFLALTGDASPETRVLRGRCIAAGHGIIYWALGEILRGACQIGLDEPVDVVRERLQSCLGEILAPLTLSPEDEQLTIAALATTVGIRLGRGSEGAGVEPASVEELARAWPRFATAYAQVGPAIWVIEDLHWAGGPAVEMIGQIARRTDGPLLIVATARPEFAEQHPAFGPGGQDAIAISLRPLTDNQSNDLVDRLLAVAELPDALRAEIVAKADGNPFYVEEILQRLIDEGALARDGERWKATQSIGAVIIPDSVQALLAARIDALLPDERRVLQEAAVVGRTFWAASLESTVDPGDLASSLEGLERKGMVLVRPTSTLAGETEYLFKHALVHDVAYATLPKARRARAHAAVADWIGGLAGDRSDEFAELIAYHYWAAVRGDGADLAWLDDPDASESVRRRAFAASLKAGRGARHRFAMDRAVELHEQALELAMGDAERLDAMEQIARDHEAGFHGDAAVASFVAALEIARKDPDGSDRVAVLARHAAGMAAHRGGSFVHEFDADMIEGLIDEGLAAATDQRERAWLLAAYGALIITRRLMATTTQEPMQPRLDAVLEAGRIAQQLDDANLMVVAAEVLTDLYVIEGDFKRALAAFEPSIPIIDRIDRPAARAQSYHSASLMMMWLTAEPRRSEALATQAYELGRRLSAHDQGHGTYGLMLISFLLGDWDRVETLLAEHLLNPELARGVHCVAVESGRALGSLVIAHRGDPERAIEVARHSRGWEERSGAVEGQLAEALVTAGAIEEGRTLATDVLDRAHSWRWSDAARALIAAIVKEGTWDELPALLARIAPVREADHMVDALAERAEGMAFAARGEADRARESLSHTLSAFDGFEMVFEVALTKEALASVSSGPERGRLLGEAIATYRSLRAAPHLARAEGLISAE